MDCPEQEVGNVPRFDDDPSLHLASSGISEARGMEGYLFQEDSDKISYNIRNKTRDLQLSRSKTCDDYYSPSKDLVN